MSGSASPKWEELASKLALKASQHRSLEAWQATVLKRAWRLAGPCEPAGPAPQLPAEPPIVFWPTEFEWPAAAGWVQPVREGLSAFTEVTERAIEQPYEGIVLFEAAREASDNEPTELVAIDYFDKPTVNEQCLAGVSLYFKMQYLRSGYADAKVVPGGYVSNNATVYDDYCRLRKLAGRRKRFDVYGRFGTRFGADLRRRAVETLQAQTRFHYTGGTSLVTHLQSLREAARARVCLDLPGNGPLCHRLVDYLAMGACVVAPRHEAVLSAELRDGENIVYCKEDLSDLVDLCAEYVADEQAARRIGAGAARFFDEHLSRPQLAGHYLRTLAGER